MQRDLNRHVIDKLTWASVIRGLAVPSQTPTETSRRIRDDDANVVEPLTATERAGIRTISSQPHLSEDEFPSLGSSGVPSRAPSTTSSKSTTACKSAPSASSVASKPSKHVGQTGRAVKHSSTRSSSSKYTRELASEIDYEALAAFRSLTERVVSSIQQPLSKADVSENVLSLDAAPTYLSGCSHHLRESRPSSGLAPPCSRRDSKLSFIDSVSDAPDLQPDLMSLSVPPTRNDMAAGINRISGDARRHPSSGNHNARFENQRPMSSLCRNGPQCRKYQEGTCSYNHDFGSAYQANGLTAASVLPSPSYMLDTEKSFSSKKSFNVDSPAFTPTFTPKSANALPVKAIGLSPKAAAAASFTPRGSGSVTPSGISHVKLPSGEFTLPQAFQPSQFSEFTPGQSFIPQPQADQQHSLQTSISHFDPFLGQQSIQHSISGLDGTQQTFNTYGQSASNVSGQQFYHDATGFKYPLNYHLSASVGPRRSDMMPYQRASADFFVLDDTREDLHKKADAALQIFANSSLPQQVEHFHSLVALDTSAQRSQSIFGHPSWLYKATSGRDGHIYALRRIEGFRLSSEQAIRHFNAWKRIGSAGVVHIHDAFTGKWFGDSSLIVVMDYFPLSQTLAEKYFTQSRPIRGTSSVVPENDLWMYIVQLASALQSIHEAGLAAQSITASKVLLTSKGRLRLSSCGVLDIIRFGQQSTIAELQRNDIQDLGRLILSVALRTQTVPQNVEKALQTISKTYSDRFRACLAWLLTPPSPEQVDRASAEQLAQSSTPNDYNVNSLLANIADKIATAFDSTLHLEDDLTSNLTKELENGRLARILMKINAVLERPETSIEPIGNNRNPALLNQASAAWSETGERYPLLLFRDYVFHQVDHEGRPVVNLGHIVTCLNKLDAGIEEEVQLVSRDEQTIVVVSFKTIKRNLESAWAELSKAASGSGRR